MMNRPFILRCAAFLLLLVFSQKAGAGLFLHNLLHSNTANSKIPLPENENSKELNYNCACGDDFFMPFTEAEKPFFADPVFSPVTLFDSYHNAISFYSSTLSFLRGPPAVIA
jgi:hypothetical protein